LPERDKRGESWDGEQWDASDAWVKELTGFSEIRATNAVEQLLGDMLGRDASLWISMHPNLELSGCCDRATPFDRKQKKDPFDGRASREEAFRDALAAKFERTPRDFKPALDDLRLVKQPEEIDAMRRAGQAGCEAMLEAIRSSAPGVGEWELAALMSWIQIEGGAAGPAYQAIVGVGANSLVLHYSVCNRRAAAGEVVLIDYAPEVDHYTSDITRTWPIDGKFSVRQAELYDAVLEAQLAGIAAVKPGATLGDVEGAARAVLDKRGLAKLLPHGVSHYIGLEVHDVGDYSRPFVPGVCFTVEPGLYESATGIGVRIEDVVVVTADGCEVLSSTCPKDRASMESLVAGEGVLDRLKKR
jgi:Xaa-Pro aminopeptidase